MDRKVLEKSEIEDLHEYFKSSILEVAKNIEDEQSLIVKESFPGIKQELQRIRDIIINDEEVKVELNQFFLKIHSRHFNTFLHIIGRNFDPSISSITEFRNLKRQSLLELLKKILFEKELIHLERLKMEILSNSSIQILVNDIQNGKLLQGLIQLEQLTLKYFQSKQAIHIEGETNNHFRKSFELVYRFQEIEKSYNAGIINEVKFIIKLKAIITELFQFIEYIFMYKASFIFSSSSSFHTGKLFSQSLERQAKNLLAEGNLVSAIDLLLENINEETQIHSDLILQKSRYIRNKKNKLLGLDFDSNLNNKVTAAILEIINY